MRTICQQERPRRAVPLYPSRNALLAMGDALALRIGWTRRDRAVSWSLSAHPSAVPSARRLTAARLTAWGLHEQVEAAELLVADLIAAALRHATATIRLALRVEDGLLRGEIENTGPAEHGQPSRNTGPPPDPDSPHLAHLACCWGVSDTVTWFELITSERH
ncbi:hypothetical protein ITP53_52410 [Nonomuraea sp. K274]|uniref:ATP-binding protein n=1 Tax=Nonomuraea cypriaca TaxID=1187855 RepID=A0A931F792_9ACTN|nr:hypothetical protein [Nonomuraea cypriaca]MBF8194138.1 hypothetical protein [Nonomuraea cypriaca]